MIAGDKPLVMLTVADLRQVIGELIAAALAGRDELDPWIPHPRWPWSRRVSLSIAKELGAIKSGRVWLLHKSEIDKAIESKRVAAPKKPVTSKEEVVDLLEMTAMAARRRRPR